MKAHTKELLTIEELADSVLMDLQESSHRKEQFLKWAIDYYKRYRMDVAREYKKTLLDMTAWKSIILPDDCVDPVIIGIPNGEDISTFTRRRLATRDCACDEDEPTPPTYTPEEGSEGFQWYQLSESGEDAGKLYGLQVKDNGLGNFKINDTQDVNEIQLSSNVPAGTRIHLTYLSTLFDPNRDNCVHPYAQPMIEAGIHWSNLKNRRRAGNRNISQQDIYDAKNEFDEALCQLAERRWELSREDIVEITREAMVLTPKH